MGPSAKKRRKERRAEEGGIWEYGKYEGMNTLIFYISVVLFFTMFAIKRLSPKRHALSSTSTSSNVIVEEKSRVNKMDRLVKVVSESSWSPVLSTPLVLFTVIVGQKSDPITSPFISFPTLCSTDGQRSAFPLPTPVLWSEALLDQAPPMSFPTLYRPL